MHRMTAQHSQSRCQPTVQQIMGTACSCHLAAQNPAMYLHGSPLTRIPCIACGYDKALMYFLYGPGLLLALRRLSRR